MCARACILVLHVMTQILIIETQIYNKNIKNIKIFTISAPQLTQPPRIAEKHGFYEYEIKTVKLNFRNHEFASYEDLKINK